MTLKQTKLLEAIPVKKHDPDGVTVRGVMAHTGWKYAHSLQYLEEKIRSGGAVPCFCKEGVRFVKAMKLK